MNQTSIRSDRGIRAIFDSALCVEPEHRSLLSRLAETFDRRHLGHALAGGTLGAGAAVAGFLVLAVSLPNTVSADPMAADGATAAAIAKADRLPVAGGKLAAIATAADVATEAARPSGDVDIGATGSALAYAVGVPNDAASAAIESNIDREGSRYASLGNSALVAPGAAAAAVADQATDDEEEDDSVVAIPRARPERPTSSIEPTALPRPRPTHFASVAPLRIMSEPGNAATGPDPIAVERTPSPRRDEAPPGVLGFFSSPTDPVRAPPKVSVETPFGIPYVLQTASVETACLKPELVDLLRTIERKYHQKVIITSGYRSRGRQGSLHRTCAAADIEIPGVSAASLAAYARTIPGIGGVGTYCHSSMIHVDVGTPRDWKYGCGSFFAMRGAPGKWGKVPAALAAAQPEGDARVDASMAQD